MAQGNGSDSSKTSHAANFEHAQGAIGIDPEEAALFSEFQAFVRAIATEMTQQSVSRLDTAVEKLSKAVDEDRQKLHGLFAPALDEVRRDLQKGTGEILEPLQIETSALAQTIQKNRAEIVNTVLPAFDKFQGAIEKKIKEHATALADAALRQHTQAVTDLQQIAVESGNSILAFGATLNKQSNTIGEHARVLQEFSRTLHSYDNAIQQNARSISTFDEKWKSISQLIAQLEGKVEALDKRIGKELSDLRADIAALANVFAQFRSSFTSFEAFCSGQLQAIIAQGQKDQSELLKAVKQSSENTDASTTDLSKKIFGVHDEVQSWNHTTVNLGRTRFKWAIALSVLNLAAVIAVVIKIFG